jgi:hypothetical protein
MAAHSEAYWERFRLGLGQELGILSLIEDPLHTVMWSHYASQHTGIVIEFDEKHPWFSQRRTKNVDLENLVQVTYVANAHPRTWKQVSATDMLYTKTAEWSYEREWRLIRAIMDGVEVSPGITCFDVTPDAIRSITFGCRTQHALEAELRTNVVASPNLRHARFKRVILLGGGKLETVDA